MLGLNMFLFFVGIPMLWICEGLAIATMWRWFICPLGVEAISTPQAMGLMIIIGTALPMTSMNAEMEKVEPQYRTIFQFSAKAVAIIVAVIFGAIIHAFM